MIKNVHLLSINYKKDAHNKRVFVVDIEGVVIDGQVQFISDKDEGPSIDFGKSQYRFLWPKGCLITKHPEYKDIRRRILIQMIQKSEGRMLSIKRVVK